jgi:1-acyl-sn-glycerol-3-phosphate acyltransferase
MVLWIAGLRKLEFKGRPSSTKEAPLVVPNHVSWLDFIILGSTTQFGFVIGEAVSMVPLIGAGFKQLGELVGCIVLDRGSVSSREETKLRMKERLLSLQATGEGQRLVVFSEGTLTNGDSVVPLKAGAFEGLVPAQPLRIELSNPHYSLASLGSFESICFFLCLSGTDVTMTWCEVVKPESDDTPQRFAEKVRCELVKNSSLKIAKSGSYRDHREVCCRKRCE